jgi:hypothetical protein|tara:strand:- start:18 stop:335 length:318 start_codon:yes stop_codon:yes gene_type:complete
MSHYTEDLATIYESFEAVSNGQYSPVQGQPSFRKGSLPGSYAGGSPRPYEMGLTGNGITAVIADEEENPILHKISELMAEAEDANMMFAIHQLGQLKKFIEKLTD